MSTSLEAHATLVGEALHPFVDSGALPGMVAVIGGRDGGMQVVALGDADPLRGEPMTSDAVFRLASMTKLVTAVGVMQLVDQGRIALDDPIGEHLPEFDDLRVLDGFDSDGEPLLRPQRGRPTIRQVLANTAGLGYEIWNGDLNRYYELTGTPSAATGLLTSLRVPLVCDPETEIHYGTGADWAGILIQRVTGSSYDDYVNAEILAVLETTDMGTRLTAAQRGRLPDVLARTDDGGYVSTGIDYPENPEFRPGGGSIYATAADFMALQLFLLNGGTHKGKRLLSSEAVSEMIRPQTGRLDIPAMPSWVPALSRTVEFEPGTSWGLGMCVNRNDIPGGRRAMSGGWAGIFNSYFWIDPASGLAAGLYLQLVPFFDEQAVAAFRSFERAVYAEAPSAIGVAGR